ASYIIDHLYEIDAMSIKTLAENCYTSTTSIIKFCQLIGFDTYAEFKKYLYSSLETRKEQLTKKCQNLQIEDLFNKIELFSQDSLDKQDLYQSVQKIVNMIIQKRSIHFYGAVFPLALVESFSEDMAIMKVPVHVHQTPFDQIDLQSNEAVNIIVTLTGRFIELNKEGFQQLCQLHQDIVLISQEVSDLKEIALQLTLPHTMNSDYDDILYILLLDLIKLSYYQFYHEHFEQRF
ncbi:MurR/RpiR family transcriptional regulator, partial [Intestinibacter bartlettii]